MFGGEVTDHVKRHKNKLIMLIVAIIVIIIIVAIGWALYDHYKPADTIIFPSFTIAAF